MLVFCVRTANAEVIIFPCALLDMKMTIAIQQLYFCFYFLMLDGGIKRNIYGLFLICFFFKYKIKQLKDNPPRVGFSLLLPEVVLSMRTNLDEPCNTVQPDLIRNNSSGFRCGVEQLVAGKRTLEFCFFLCQLRSQHKGISLSPSAQRNKLH